MQWDTSTVHPPRVGIESIELQISLPAGLSGAGDVSDEGLPTWSFARLHTALRRSPPNEVLRRCRAATGRAESELDLAAKMLERLRTTVRTQTVRDVRVALAENSYENELKMEVAVERLLEDLAGVPWR
jgi:hypothetical protein